MGEEAIIALSLNIVAGIGAQLVSARWVGLAQSDPRGILIAGANEIACAIGDAIGKYEFEVTHVDTDSERSSRARLDGREVIRGNILSDQVHDGLEPGELGILLALTPNDEVNVLATHHYGRILGRRNVYQAAPSEAGRGILGSLPFHLTARVLFDPELTYRKLEDRLAAGAVVRGTTLGGEFDWEAYQARHGSRFRPLFVVSAEGRLSAFTDSSRPSPKNGDTIVSLLETENGRAEARST